MNKREPLLSDYALEQTDGLGDPLMGSWAVRDHYERLIDEGKLRLVEEVELWHPTVPQAEWRAWLSGSDAEFSMLVTKCCGRNPWTPPWGMGKAYMDGGEVKRERHEYVCPGCGNKIKR